MPEELGPAAARVGSVLRVPLHGRRVRAWVVAVGSPPPAGVEPQPVIELVSLGPPPEVVDVARWGAWRYAGRLRPFLAAASSPTVVRTLPDPPRSTPGWRAAPRSVVADQVTEALAARDAVLRVSPAQLRLPIVEATLAACGGPVLVLVESREDVETLTDRLRRLGTGVARYPDDWGRAATVSGGPSTGPPAEPSGGPVVVVGTRNAALAPGRYAAILVLDAHAEAYRSERVPTFDARVLVAERARRSGIPVCFVSPCPPVELLEGRRLVVPPASLERHGWGRVITLDQREADPREGGYPSRLALLVQKAVRDEPARQVVCVLNRVGRARLLACGSCRSVQRCPRCTAAQTMPERPPKAEVGRLVCPRCGDPEPAICPACGSARLRILRPGVARAREQLEALLGLPVGEVSGPRATVPETPVVVGTEAVLWRLRAASMVAFLDFDQEVLAARFRAAEEALVLLARAIRLTAVARGPVVVRTSVPDHEVVRSAELGDPGILAEAELGRRRLLGLPPASALALLGGERPDVDDALSVLTTRSLEHWSVPDGAVVRASDATTLADGLARLAAGRVGGWAEVPVRVEVDPLRL